MPDPVLKAYDSTDTSIVTTLTFASVLPGTPTAAQELHYWNDKGDVVSADTAKGVRLSVLARNQGDANFVGSGLEVLDTKAIEVRVIGVQGAAVDVTTGWTKIGTNADLSLPDIPKDSAVELEHRISMPSGSDTTTVEIAFKLSSVQATFVGRYHGLQNGIRLGIGDGQSFGLAESDGVLEDGTPDDTVIIDDVAWIHEGIPYRLLNYNETINANDGDVAALASGESYYCALTLGAGTVTQTKGSKAADPLTDADKPALPADEAFLAWVVRSFDNIINTADITEAAAVTTPDFFGYSDSGLAASIGKGEAYVNGSLVETDSINQYTLTASTTTTIYLLEDGSLDDNPGTAKRGMPLHYFVTDGSGVTAHTDLRQFFDQLAVVAMFHFHDTPAATDWTAWKNPFNYLLYLRPLVNSILVQLHQEPGSLGHASGNWILDVEKQGTGDSGWTTIFTSQGSDDQRPTIAYDAGTTKETGAARPEVLVVQPGESLRVQVDAIPTGGSDVDAITVAIPLDVFR